MSERAGCFVSKRFKSIYEGLLRRNYFYIVDLKYVIGLVILKSLTSIILKKMSWNFLTYDPHYSKQIFYWL